MSELEALRDAVARVRAIHQPIEVLAGADFRQARECSACGGDEPLSYPCLTIAALDGAPEPEWEWGLRDADCGMTYVVDRPKDSAISSGRYLRRRKAGPWEPVGSETDG